MENEETQTGEGTAEEKVQEETAEMETYETLNVSTEDEVKEEKEKAQGQVSVQEEVEEGDENVAVSNVQVNSVEVINQAGKVVEIFTAEKNGPDFVKLAKDFANNLGHMIGYK